MNKYKDFEDWFLEIESSGTRCERFYESLDAFKSQLGSAANHFVWMKAAFEAAREQVVHVVEYSEEYDSYYIAATNEWVEPKCSDPSCHFCLNRPEKPLL